MSMAYSLLGLSTSQIATVRSTPTLADSLRMAAIEIDPYKIAPILVRPEFHPLGPLEPALALYTSWHILHYVFTGHASSFAAPGDLLLGGGEEVGQDMGYGPARLHSESDTTAFSRFIAGLTVARLQDRIDYNPMAAAGIYGLPGGGRTTILENTAELREVVALSFPPLQRYLSKIATRSQGLLTWLI